jgi:tryptophan synthase alpha chain
MTEISDKFAALKQKNEGALIGYLTVGDPNPKKTPSLVGALIDGGADIVELGIPFSDPIVEGETIQGAIGRSLASGCRPIDVIEIAEKIHRKYDAPLIVMTYYNPIFRIGAARFLKSARHAGISGMIVPDLAIEESEEFKKHCSAENVDTIFLATPSTGPERLKEIVARTSGYLYLVSLYGVTGARDSVADTTLSLVKEYKGMIPESLPLAVGFGISKPAHVKQILAAGADGAMVGSAFVQVLGRNAGNPRRTAKELKSLAKKLKQATRPSG